MPEQATGTVASKSEGVKSTPQLFGAGAHRRALQARAQTALAIRTLTGVCGSKAAPAAARVSASRIVVRCPVLMP